MSRFPRAALSVVPGGQTAPGRPQKSWSTAVDRRPRQRLEPARFRADFAARWSRFLWAEFGSANKVALEFDVTLQCALNWLDGGVCRPSGDFVAMAAVKRPDAFRAHIGPEF